MELGFGFQSEALDKLLMLAVGVFFGFVLLKAVSGSLGWLAFGIAMIPVAYLVKSQIGYFRMQDGFMGEAIGMSLLAIVILVFGGFLVAQFNDTANSNPEFKEKWCINTYHVTAKNDFTHEVETLTTNAIDEDAAIEEMKELIRTKRTTETNPYAWNIIVTKS